MCTPVALHMYHQERNQGQTTAALAGSLDPVIGKIMCAAPVCTFNFDGMSDDEGINNDERNWHQWERVIWIATKLSAHSASQNCLPFGNTR